MLNAQSRVLLFVSNKPNSLSRLSRPVLALLFLLSLHGLLRPNAYESLLPHHNICNDAN